MSSPENTPDPAAEIHESLLANVGHELRTPMNSILGFADLLMDMDLTEEQLSYVKLLRQSGSQLLAMINNLLDYSRAAASRIQIDAIAFDLRVLVEDTADALAIQAEQKGIALACHVDAEVPAQVVADPQYLRQIINNLTGNAIKFTSDGEVVIEVKMAAREAGIPEQPRSAVLEVSVTDTGIGIAPDRHALIFERFAQADPAIARRFGGTGLGLTISKQLVELMGGRIHVDSTPGQGSRFWCTLPVGIGAETAAPARAERPARPDITGLRILVADANATYRRILMKMLMNFGCSPVAVGSGQAALDALAQPCGGMRPFDLLIMDLTLPDMDGGALITAVHGRGAPSRLRVIVLTSMTRRRQAQELAALGCHGYLTKPVRQSVLQDVIGDVVSGGGPSLVTRHSVAERKFKGIRVLLAEDNHISAQMLRKVLISSGYSVVTVTDGEKAVRAAQREPYDLVLMDVRMPLVDGLEATRRIRTTAGRVPIIGLTASNLKTDAEACLAAGMDAVASKPIYPRDLLEMVAAIVTGQGGAGPQCPPRSVPEAPPIAMDKALERALGDAAFLQELLDVFLSSLADQLRSLDAALSAGRRDTVVEIAHKLKGAAGNLCAEGVYDLAVQLETAALEGRDGDARRLMVNLRQEAERLTAFVGKSP